MTRDQMIDDILMELNRARMKFPSTVTQPTVVALMEEVGELAKAAMEESPDRVYREAVQVAVMAMRVVLDGDFTLEARRNENGQQPIVAKSYRL